MALFAKDEKVQRPDISRPTTGTPPRQADIPVEEAVQAHLGKGSRVEGKLSFDGSVHIDGHVEGQIQAQEAIIIGDSAVINAEIQGETVVVKGRVTGDITARKRVELRAPGKLTGNITTPSLVIHEGVTFEGHCSMGGGPESRTDKTDRKVALFPKEDRINPNPVRMPSEAMK